MYLPDFVFEDEDIEVLKDNNIFLREYVDKISGNTYFKLNNLKFNELIDFIYQNKNFDDVNKTDIEFKFRIVSEIYTAIMDNTGDALLITSMILNLHNIDPETSKQLMSVSNRRRSKLKQDVE
jgi:hypothetical protein